MTTTKPKRQYPRVSITFKKPSKTKQQFKNIANINNLVNQYLSSGEHQHLNPRPPQYGYASGKDFLESLVIVDDAKQMFAALPSNIRSQFDNDPASFLDFTADPANRTAMAEMGLLTPEAADALLLPDIAADDALPGDTDLSDPVADATSDGESE